MFQVGSEFKDYLAFKATEFGQAVKIAATQLIEQETSEQSRFLQNSRLQSKLENVNALLDAIKHFNKKTGCLEDQWNNDFVNELVFPVKRNRYL